MKETITYVSRPHMLLSF